MPIIDYWLDRTRKVDWVPCSKSPLNPELKGPTFFEHPLTWLLPRVRLRKKDLKDAPTNVWIVDIDLKSRLGKINDRNRKEFVIDLPEKFEEYLQMISSKRRKKFKYIMRKNSDLKIVEDNFEDLKAAWQWYVKRLAVLNRTQNDEEATEEELKLRWEIFHSKNSHTLSFYHNGQLVGVNISLWGDSRPKTIYDLAFLRRENEVLNKRALGFYAILKNIEIAMAKEYKVYNLLTGDCGYKTEFATRMSPLKQYIRCTEEFARAYNIPLEDICEIVSEKDIERQLHPEKPIVAVLTREDLHREKPPTLAETVREIRH
jgi:hypothetical protein